MDEMNVFTGKTVEEAIAAGLQSLGITESEAEITVLEEGRKKIIGSIKAKVSIRKKASDGQRAVQFLEGLLEILKLNAVTELISDGEKVEINLTSTDSSRLIGHHGEVLDAMQTLAGAVANIGREDYKKVVVDCENYREGREKTLCELAHKLAAKAVDRQRRVALEPMNPNERRIIHSALSESEEVKTISSGKEPNRFVVIIPNNEKPYERRERSDRRFGGRDERGGKGFRGDRRQRGGRDERRGAPRQSGSSLPKKEIRFGTFLGNSSDKDE